MLQPHSDVDTGVYCKLLEVPHSITCSAIPYIIDFAVSDLIKFAINKPDTLFDMTWHIFRTTVEFVILILYVLYIYIINYSYYSIMQHACIIDHATCKTLLHLMQYLLDKRRFLNFYNVFPLRTWTRLLRPFLMKPRTFRAAFFLLISIVCEVSYFSVYDAEIL